MPQLTKCLEQCSVFLRSSCLPQQCPEGGENNAAEHTIATLILTSVALVSAPSTTPS